jgi:hypothetical protein
MGLPYQAQTFSGAGTTASINLDPSVADFKVRVRATVTGTISYKMQLSMNSDPVADSAAVWWDSTEIPAGTVATDEELINYPVARIRFVIASGSGSIFVETLQGFMVG